MIRFLLLPWWWIQRRTDLQILWPICRDFALDKAQAREAFLIHAMRSPCWIGYYGERALLARVRALD